MKYQTYELAHTMMQPWRAQSRCLHQAYTSPLNPIAYTSIR
jgi:poly-beta-hydroxyalkanoate depolymerase